MKKKHNKQTNKKDPHIKLYDFLVFKIYRIKNIQSVKCNFHFNSGTHKITF